MVELALIGAGRWGKNYIKTIQSLPDAHLKYVVTHSGSSLETLAGDFDRSTDIEKPLSDKSLGGIIIATPPSSHLELASLFLKAGHSLLIEKPLATNSSDALKLVQAKPPGSTAMVGHTMLFSPAYIELKRLLPSIGPIQYIRYEGMNYGPFRDDYSALWDWGPHGVAHVLDLLGTSPTKISAVTIDKLRPNQNLQDMVTIQLQFPGDIPAIIDTGWLSPTKKRTLTIMGENGALVFDDLAKTKLTLFTKNKGNLTPTTPTFPSTSPLEVQLRSFLTAITNHTQPESDLTFGYLVTKVLEIAEYSSNYQGQQVKFTI